MCGVNHDVTVETYRGFPQCIGWGSKGAHLFDLCFLFTCLSVVTALVVEVDFFFRSSFIPSLSFRRCEAEGTGGRLLSSFPVSFVLSLCRSVDTALVGVQRRLLSSLPLSFVLSICRSVDTALVGEEECVYFCGNSLGLMPKTTPDCINRELDKWAKT